MMHNSGDSPIGVLVVEYGEPQTLDEVEAYLTSHYGGHTPPAADVADWRERCQRIWGGTQNTHPAQAISTALAQELEQRAAGRYHVALAARYWHPFVADALPRLVEAGCRDVIVLPLAPHVSQMALRDYHRALDRAASQCSGSPRLHLIEEWPELPGFLATVRTHARAALAHFPEAVQHQVCAVFCAHSVAESERKPEDAYRRKIEYSSAHIARDLHLTAWRIAFYGAEGPGQWLGPDMVALLDQLHDEGIRHVLYVPISGVYDNVEILHELDVRVPRRAAELGMEVQCAALMNTAPPLIGSLADLVIRLPSSFSCTESIELAGGADEGER